MKHAEFDADFSTSGSAERRHRLAAYQKGPKRVLDLVVLAVLAPFLLPLIAGLWALVRFDGGPGFFGHERVGQGGRSFTCWKIRTMCPGAEARLKAHLKSDRAAAREWAANYKLRADPRITRIGVLLRQSSLDELPQFWNVLRGEMSLVGPRPVPRAELEEYVGYEWAYLSCRPGITGLWQVSGRNALDYAARVKMDMSYLFAAGFRMDVAILVRTIGVVLRRTGI